MASRTITSGVLFLPGRLRRHVLHVFYPINSSTAIFPPHGASKPRRRFLCQVAGVEFITRPPRVGSKGLSAKWRLIGKDTREWVNYTPVTSTSADLHTDVITWFVGMPAPVSSHKAQSRPFSLLQLVPSPMMVRTESSRTKYDSHLVHPQG